MRRLRSTDTGNNKVASNQAVVEKQIDDLKLATDAKIVQQKSLVREVLIDRANLDIDKLDKKWKPRFHDFCKAQLPVGILTVIETFFGGYDYG